MAKTYYHISPVGQLDDKACWAACLKWWFKAARSIKKSQRKIIDKYNYLTDEYGAMSDQAMQQVLQMNGLKQVVYPNARHFTSNELWRYLQKAPVYIAFTESSTMTKHVNVVHDITGTVANPSLTVMEPQAEELPDLSYRGQHELKPLSEFNQNGSIIIGVKG